MFLFLYVRFMCSLLAPN
uniref:Uncharacterized protein n=1 Tax=Arundo donax TaxID=35708 RepID=A0A0A9AKM4_ARUDO